VPANLEPNLDVVEFNEALAAQAHACLRGVGLRTIASM
jgi:hypothetical protein